MANAFKEKLKRGETVTVINPDYPSPGLVEFIAKLGFDAVFIDCEHGVAGIERVEEMCRAARAGGISSIVRPDSDEPWLISRYLDAGAAGVMVPHVHTAQAAKRIVDTVRYARFRDWQDKTIVAMIESVDAVKNLSKILGVDGIDVYFVGPGDLSHTMGMPGQMSHPKVVAVVDKVIRQIRKRGKAAGTLVNRDTVEHFVGVGAQYLYEHANSFLRTGGAEFLGRIKKGS